MSPYRDERSPMRRNEARAYPHRPFAYGPTPEEEEDSGSAGDDVAREQERNLLDRSDRSSDADFYDPREEKGERLQQYRSLAPRVTRQQILTFFILVLLILAVIFSQLFIELPPETMEALQQSGQQAWNFPLPPPPKARAPQDYMLDPFWNFDAPPQRREFTWLIQDVVKHPDGVYRQMMLINGQFPGPLVEVNEGDTLVVHVENRAQNATAIHWHGIYQNGTNSMDGTVGITQCPIAPGANFTYEFTVDNQVGTYWYHAHHGVQAADGLAGPMVIHSKHEFELSPVWYATDRVVMVSDYYYTPSSQLLMEYLASDRENAEPTPDTALINGRGVRDCSQYPELICDNSTVRFPQFNLEPNQSHRLRIINTGQFAEFQVTVDEHPFRITEVDGTVVQAAEYDRLNINPAQRYSIILDALSTERDSFWLRAKMLTKCFQNPDRRMNPEARAIIKYGPKDHMIVQDMPESKDRPDGPDLECRDLNVTDLEALPVIEAPQPDATFYLRSNFEIGAWRLSRGFFNQSSWRPDLTSPSLHRAIDGLHRSDPAFINTSMPADGGGIAFVNHEAFDSAKELVIQTDGYQVIDLIISNFDDGNHPLHLHGHKFYVMAQGHGYPPANLYDTLNITNPMRRDTASVEAYGWTMLRIVADNPGAWAFHCHVSWHAEAGLMMQLLARTDILAERELPPASRALCAAPLEQLRLGATPDDEVFMVETAATTSTGTSTTATGSASSVALKMSTGIVSRVSTKVTGTGTSTSINTSNVEHAQR